MILNEGFYTPQCSLLLRLDRQSVEERIKYQYCVLVFKIQNNLTPTYLESLICKRAVNYRTRYSTKCPLQLYPAEGQNIKETLFHYVGASLFNTLPVITQMCTCLNKF